MKWLICEGKCNPTVQALTEAIRSERSRHHAFGPMALSPALLQDLQRLRHTAHHLSRIRMRVSGGTEERWVCNTCGADRRYGVTE